MTLPDSSEWPDLDGADDALDSANPCDGGARLRDMWYARFAAQLPAPYYADDLGLGWLVRKAVGQPWRVYRLDTAPAARRAWRTTDGTIVATDLTLRAAYRAAYILRGKHASK